VLYGVQRWLKQKKWYENAKRTPFKALYEGPLISKKKRVIDQDFLVVDCEMSGLSVKKNDLLSIGWVRIVKGQIDYGSRKHILIHSPETVGESVKIHGLCDQQLAGASSASKVLSLLAGQIEGAVLVFHHAILDIAFLRKSALQTFGCPMIFSYVDTMHIEKRRLERQSKTASLQLNLCRDRYGLPPAFQHNAMFDAVATAELLLAQCANLDNHSKTKESLLTLSDLELRLS